MKESYLKPKKVSSVKTSKLAVLSLIFVSTSIMLLYTINETCGLYRIIKSTAVLATLASSTFTGILVIYKIRRSEVHLKGKGLAIVSIILSFALFFVVLMKQRVLSVPYTMLCAQNLSNIGKALGVYANDNAETLPTASNWCDLLIEHTTVTDKDFICPASFLPVYSYAFNKNLDGLHFGEFPKDVVLLFEIKRGRNVSGGPELMTTERHNQRVCVLFGDLHVKIIEWYELEHLKWDVDASY